MNFLTSGLSKQSTITTKKAKLWTPISHPQRQEHILLRRPRFFCATRQSTDEAQTALVARIRKESEDSSSKLGRANLDVDFQVRMERGSSKQKNRKSRHSRLSSPSPPALPPTPSTEILSIPTDEAAQLRDHAQAWHERHVGTAGRRIEALEDNLGLDAKTKTRGAKSKTRGATKKDADPDQVQRDERQLACWKAVRDVLGELEPDESLRDAFEMLYLGPLINQVRQLDSFNGTQTRIARLRERCQRKRRELRRVEMDLEEIEKTLEQRDEEMRSRFWRCLRYYRGHFRNFDDGKD